MSLIAFIPAGQTNITVNGLHQWDYGQTLEIHDETLPALIEVHFACIGMRDAVVKTCHTIGGVATVVIPDQCLEQTTPVTAWIYEIGETSGATIKTITLPITARAKPPMGNTPSNAADKYTEAVAAMNEIVEKYKNGEIVPQTVDENRAKIAVLENQTQSYAVLFEEISLGIVALTDRISALENSSGGSGSAPDSPSGGSGSYSVVQVTIKNNSIAAISGTYTNAENQSGTTYEIAPSGAKTLSVVKGTTVRFSSVASMDITVGSSSYGYGPHTSGGYYFVASGSGSITIVDPVFTVKVSYSGENANLTWTPVANADRYDIHCDGWFTGSTTDTKYTVTPDNAPDPSSCECAVAAVNSNGTVIAHGKVTISFT